MYLHYAGATPAERQGASLPRVRPLETDGAPAEARELFERFRRERDNVPNMFRTLALRPEVMTASYTEDTRFLGGGEDSVTAAAQTA